MSIRELPAPQALQRPDGYTWEAPFDAMEKWAALAAAPPDGEDPSTISIFDTIGSDGFGGGVSEKRISAALRKIGRQDVTVQVNSPGGDMFAGMAIYNLLREHPAKVTVKVMGLAASAASLIAMAGDQIDMGAGSMMMIHRAWGLAIGNSHDFADASKIFGRFDQSMASIYSARTGMSQSEVMAMLDGPRRGSDGTWMTAQEAVDQGFADTVVDAPAPADASAQVPAHILARRQIEADLARAGIPRAARESRINALLGARDATRQAERDAGDELAGLRRLIATIQP